MGETKNLDYSEICNLISSDNIEKVREGCFYFEQLLDDEKTNNKDNKINFLLEKYNGTTGEIKIELFHCICILSVIFEKLQILVFDNLKKDNIQFLQVISSVVLSKSQELINNKYLERLLFNFSDIECDNPNVIYNIDFSLYYIWDQEEDFVLEFLFNWIKNNQNINNFTDKWDNICNKIAQDNEKSSYFITKCFLEDSSKYHIVASDFISHAFIGSNNNVVLSSSLLTNCAKEDLIFIARKMLGYIFLGERLCQVFDSMLCSESEDVSDFALSIFMELLCKQYLHTVTEYFSVKELDKSKYSLKCKKIMEYCKQLSEEKLKYDFPDMVITHDNFIEIQRLKTEQSKKISQQAENQSVLADIVTKIPLKYGTGFCYGEGSGITKLAEFGMSFEIPYDEICCPVENKMNIFMLRRYKRGDT